MLPTAHLAATYILWWILGGYFGHDTTSLVLAILFGVFIDGDAILLGSKHRVSILHSIVPWPVVVAILYIAGTPYYWTPICAIIHILMDSLDWGVYAFYPISSRIYGLRIIGKNSRLIPGKNRIVDFTKEYLSNKLFLALEIIFGITALVLFLGSKI